MPDPWLLVAVCTNRPPEAIAPTLEALGEQLRDSDDATGVIVANTTAEEGPRLRRIAANAGFELDVLEQPGIATARNRAVELAEGERVVAFIDDDVIPAADWLERLLAHWRQAPAEVACIGGPILPRWVEQPPAWMSHRLDVTFSLMYRGEGTKALLPGVEDAFTVNGSFRAEAVREVGGFDLALGHSAGQTMFGEDTEVQVRLAQHGYRGLYTGDVKVEHRIDPERMRLRAVFRRRFYNGVSMRMTGQWSLLDGVARLLGGAVEAVIATLLRRKPEMAEGISRIGSGAGVLAAPVAGRRLRR
jgi:GT2 family glycosyltransferase